MSKPIQLSCPECNSENIELKAWINKDGKFQSWVDDDGCEAYCLKCQDYIRCNLNEKPQLKKKDDSSLTIEQEATRNG